MHATGGRLEEHQKHQHILHNCDATISCLLEAVNMCVLHMFGNVVQLT